MSKITNDGGLTGLAPHRMLYSCTHMATVGVKGLSCGLSFTLRHSYSLRS